MVDKSNIRISHTKICMCVSDLTDHNLIISLANGNDYSFRMYLLAMENKMCNWGENLKKTYFLQIMDFIIWQWLLICSTHLYFGRSQPSSFICDCYGDSLWLSAMKVRAARLIGSAGFYPACLCFSCRLSITQTISLYCNMPPQWLLWILLQQTQ